jgi:phage-related protein
MDLQKIFVTVGVKGQEALKGLDEVGKKSEDTGKKLGPKLEEASKKGENALTKLGNGAKKVGAGLAKAIGVGLAGAATGIGILGKKAIEEYSQYEQLTGGVETLFKNSSGKVMGYANNAYKTAGLSANQYMETVTSFSASLLQSLHGDTNKAAKTADMAITDMSDNANKMGSSMESIQVAYQGFAKQNYTMLDNLKLGYGGTKEEMQRLLDDAGKIAGTKFDISSYADVTKAIHVMQENMGIAGTTAKEASTTIEGSVNQMKAAWTNFVGGLADPAQNQDQLFKNLMDSIDGVAKNLVPRIQAMLPILVTGISKVVQTLAGRLPQLLQSLLPALMSGAQNLLTSFVGMIPGILTVLTQMAPQIINAILKVSLQVAQQLPQIIQSIAQALPGIISTLANSIALYAPQFIQATVQIILAIVQALPQIILAIVNALPVIIPAIVNAIVMCAPQLVEAVLLLVAAMVEAFFSLLNSIPEIIVGIVQSFAPLGAQLMTVISGAMNKVKEVFVNIWNSIKSFFINIWNSIKSVVSNAVNGVKNVVSTVFGAVKSKISSIFKAIKSTVTSVWNGIKSGISSAVNAIKSTISRVFGSIKDTMTKPFTAAWNFIKGIVDKLKNVFSFKWKLPHLDLPHISIKGGKAPYGIGGKGSLPSFSVDWYAKAMNSPMLLTKPTAFGINSSGGIRAGGEAGDELVGGSDTIMSMIRQAVAEGGGNQEVLFAILALLERLEANLVTMISQGMDGTTFNINQREFARMVKKA